MDRLALAPQSARTPAVAAQCTPSRRQRAANTEDHLPLRATPSDRFRWTHVHTHPNPNLTALPLTIHVLEQLREQLEKADALQSVTRMNHMELNLNVLIPGGPPTNSLAEKMQATMVAPRGPELPM